jgi:tetratricopeptide repeat protein
LLALWTLLVLARARRRAFDPVELLLLAGLGLLSMRIQRFSGFFGLAALPYVARDLAEWLARRRWPAPLESRTARAALAILGCGAMVFARWAGHWDQVGLRLERKLFPIAACDFAQAHDLRGRVFNPFHLGGYMLYRFWPDRSRLPFMDIHQSGTPEIRDDYVEAMTTSEGWARLRDRYRIDWVLGWRVQVAGDHLLDFLDADSSFALVFLDDAAALYVRRQSRLAGVAQAWRYRLLPGGRAAIGALGAACASDSVLRGRVRAELQRQSRGSPWNATAQSLLANIALQETRWEDARAALDQALRVDPRTPRLHERLAMVALAERRLEEAAREIERERRAEPGNPMLPELAERLASARGGR